MEWRPLPAAEWLPDQPDLDNPGATVAYNCIASTGSYIPLPELAAQTAATGTQRVRGAFAAKDTAGNTAVYAGDAGALYDLSATAWDNISKTGGYSGTATDDVWTFAQWGNKVVATNYNNAVQAATIGSGSFSDLSGCATRAKYVAVVRDFLVLGNIFESATAKPNVARWSAFNNINDWTASDETQSGSQEFFEGGHITGIVGGEQMTVFQEEAITRGLYAGPPLVWDFQKIRRQQGTRIPGSIANHGMMTFFLSDDDFYLLTGEGAQPIGSQRIARTFYNDFDASYSERVCSAIDPQRTLVVWAYPGSGHVGGGPNRLLIYNWSVNRWTRADVDTEMLLRFMSPGYTLEGLDVFGTLDALPASLDSAVWMGGALSFAAFDHLHKLANFSGDPMTAQVDTAELRAAPGRRLELTNTRPLVDGGTAQIQIGTRDSQANNVTWSSNISTNAAGECNVFRNARFVRGRVIASGQWKHIQGIDAYVRAAGRY